MATTLWPTNGTFSGRQLRQALGAFWGGLTGRPLGPVRVSWSARRRTP
jgi:hypothetical protein